MRNPASTSSIGSLNGQHEPAAALVQRLEDRTATIGVVGLGYVGLPLAVEYAGNGFSTIGFDVDGERTAQLNGGTNYIDDVDGDALRDAVQDGRFRADSSFDALQEADVIYICVPTPVTEHKDPDTSYIEAAAASIADHLRAGQLIILKSTTFPGTTQELVQPALEQSAQEQDLQLGTDYFLAFSPERIDPGNEEFTTSNTPVVVGGVTETCQQVAVAALQQIVAHVHEVSSPKVAEMEKLLENIFRNVNIALVNELAQLCDRMGDISVWEVIEAAATKPFGYMPFYPGPGLGGHCIPVDPHYLAWMARQHDFETSFITLSARVNEEMPFYVTESVTRAIAEQPVRLRDARVLILGAAFKKNVNDTRHSPTYKIMQILHEKRIGQIDYSDPHVPELELTPREGGVRETLESTELSPERLGSYDVAVIVTDHDAFPYDLIVEHVPKVVDARNALGERARDADNVILLGGQRNGTVSGIHTA
jgi:UDP-N-acetyl-D-glucosamine dehydrogenase